VRALFTVHLHPARSYHCVPNFKWLALMGVVGAMTGLGATWFHVGME